MSASTAGPEQVELQSWGRLGRTSSLCWRPNSIDALRSTLLSNHARGLIARGCGRSYGDACLNDRGGIADMRALAEVVSFDESTGDLECGAGLTFGQLMSEFVPRGFAAPICPGTSFVTLGGAIANDVHGKNHHRAGSIGDVVTGFDLLLPSGEMIAVTRESEPELFAATIGGIGLTGIVTRIRLRLERTPSNAMAVEERRGRDLDELMDALIAAQETHSHAVAWVDTLGRGRRLGRGILELANPSPTPVPRAGIRALRIPFDFPAWVLNAQSISAFNELYFRRIPARGRTRVVPLERFLCPLDSLLDCNRMYGRRGVLQFQAVLPREAAARAFPRMLIAARDAGAASFLAVLKTLHHAGRGMLSFPTPGFSLALDFPRRAETSALVSRLHDMAIEYGGRVYLAKDATLTPDQFRAMYPRVREFTSVLRRIDPTGRMRSDMARRLGLIEADAA